MAVPNIILDSDLDQQTRLRLALTGGSAMDIEAREVTIEDIKSNWPMLQDSGCFPVDILKYANNELEMSAEIFTRLMKSLNSYL